MIRSGPLYRALCLTAGAACLSAIALAQDESFPTVESIGEARIEVPPAYTEFSLELRKTDSTLEASADQVLLFEENLRKTLKKEDLLTASIQMSGVHFDGLPSTEAAILARIRFTLDPHATPGTRARRTAKVSDGMLKLAALLDCEVRGPFYGVDDREAIEQEAIARATENALYKADAVAMVMNVSIVAVQSVRVLEVNWGQEDAAAGAERADAKRLVCTARTKIVYRMSAS